jgi:class 3 adenylate cyclase
VEWEDDTYRGAVLQRIRRVREAAHAGQILCAEATAVLLRHTLPLEVGLIDLGRFRLPSVSGAERLFQIDDTGCPRQAFPPPRAVPVP